MVADRIHSELTWCVQNIPDEIAEANTINSTVCKAFLSRFCLFEGTWRKYHGIKEDGQYISGQKLLEECFAVSKELAEKEHLCSGATATTGTKAAAGVRCGLPMTSGRFLQCSSM